MTKSALAGWLSGARQRVGLRGEHGRELSPWLNNVLVRPQKPHVIDRSLELLSPLGVRNPRVQWRFPADDQARQTMQQAVRALGLRSGYAVINPGATWDSRLWETSRFGAVARYLGQQHELPTLVVWGSDRERHWAEEIVAHSGGHARLAPPTNLMELAALIQGGRLFISPDTGPLHIAVAVGTPSISLHGPTRAEVSGAYGPQHATIQVHYQPGSHKQRRQADNSAMRMITVDMVCQHCTALLARTRASIQRDAA
jgi:ADP-heptose:LPS heptosyltransferase